jgi:ADP-heptose:LPS heptosyltransferase
VAELFRGSAAFAGVWADGEERHSSWALRTLLRETGAAAVINLPRSLRALVAAWMARVPLRAGWREGGGSLLATCSLPFAAPGHQLDRYAALLAKAYPGLAPAPAAPFRPRSSALEAGDLACRELGRPFAALALGAMTPTKRLGTPVWVALIPLLRAAGLTPVLLGGAGEDEAQAAGILALEPAVANLTGRLPLSATAAVIARAAVLVGNDSALSHLAAACATPVLAVFGPTLPSATAPVGAKVTVARKADLPCLECRLFRCPVPGHPCMNALAPQELMTQITRLAEGS